MSQAEAAGDYGPGAYRSDAIPPLPEPPRKRERFGEDLLPFGDYAHIDPHQRVVEDAELVQHEDRQDPEFYKSDDWWWNHRRISFLKSQLGLSVVLMGFPAVYFFFLYAFPFGLSLSIEDYLRSEHSDLAYAAIGGFLLLAGLLVAMVLTVYTTQPVFNFLLRFFALLLKPFHSLLAARGRRYLETRRSEFNRRTGMVRFARGRWKAPLEAPFVEFDAYLERVVQRGGIFYRLMFVHRYSGEQFSQTSLSGVVAHHHEVRALWDMLQRYMDVTQPLPDVPRLEPFRHLDPVTSDQDRNTGRDPRYWRDLDLEAWKAGEGAERHTAQANYPWRQLRCRLTPQLGRIDMDSYRARQARLQPDIAT